jgi:hypothetical protein
MSKIALTPNATGTGVFTISSPATNTDRSLTLPDEAGTVDLLQRAGNVLQVVNSIYSTQTSNTTSTYVDSGLTASITPSSATSKILAIITIAGVRKVTSNTFGEFIFVRNGTKLIDMESSATRNGLTQENAVGSVSASYLDAPSLTSAIIYKVQFASANNNDGIYIQIAGNTASTSTLTLMEIAG